MCAVSTTLTKIAPWTNVVYLRKPSVVYHEACWMIRLESDFRKLRYFLKCLEYVDCCRQSAIITSDVTAC